MFHAVEHVGRRNRAPEDVPFVDQVGEPPRVLLGPELAPGLLPLRVEQLKDAPAQPGQQRRRPSRPSRTT